MNFQAHRRSTLRNYTALVTNPHWRQYVEHQVREMAKDCPALYSDLPAAVEAALAAHRRTTTSPPLSKPMVTPPNPKSGA
jgi:hypothetical protein